MELRGQPTGPVPDGGRLLNTVLDNGINFIYTTIDYGRSEKRIREFPRLLQRRLRARFQVRLRVRRAAGLRTWAHSREHRRQPRGSRLRLL